MERKELEAKLDKYGASYSDHDSKTVLYQKLYNCNPAAFAAANQDEFQMGMTLRDWYAGKALQGYLANEVLMDNIGIDSGDTLAEKAYMVADNMLAQRLK